jgi:polysaccharide biosynthesis protein PslG
VRPGRLRLVLCGLASVAALLFAGSAPAAAHPATPPRAFFGVVPQRPLTAPDFDRMRGVVGTLRIPVFWPQVEPRAGEFDFAELDRTVSGAAEAGVRVLPFVYGTPQWLASEPALPPLTAGGQHAWASFLRVLVRRYGPGGDLWREASPLPIRMWQIWNEPNFTIFWRPRPSPSGYARLLRISARAIQREDRGARIVAAGVAPVEGGMLPWEFLRRLLSIPGAGRLIDIVAVHPYAIQLTGIAYQIRLARRAMAQAGMGRMPLLVSEFGIASGARQPTGFDRGLRGQAAFLRRAYEMLLSQRRRWRIAGVDWYAWQDMPLPDPHCVFCQFAGLFDRNGEPKPAWWALRRVATSPRPGV